MRNRLAVQRQLNAIALPEDEHYFLDTYRFKVEWGFDIIEERLKYRQSQALNNMRQQMRLR